MTNFSNQNENSSNQPSNSIEQKASDQAANIADRAEQVADQVEDMPNRVANQAERASEQVERASDQVSDQVQAAKSAVTEPLPTPPKMSGNQATAEELLKRLNWGEPALTIIDARSREAFNAERITGAMSRDQVADATESSLEYQRDLYVYGDGSNQADEVVSQLRQAGYQKVAFLQGGLSAWKAIGGPTEGVEAFSSPAGAKV
ncbi:rhodanese-like domain-containing protein [Nodosilinea nodulosa]|uniref:rhodanese-like domain-containing protein n=1 Tax=Nodosilinea nodulosa TaxID=416001 RepID=UPI0002E6B1FE|nr:rhodanese-like domain-containing protein [Nodosilinea nodulosa]